MLSDGLRDELDFLIQTGNLLSDRLLVVIDLLFERGIIRLEEVKLVVVSLGEMIVWRLGWCSSCYFVRHGLLVEGSAFTNAEIRLHVSRRMVHMGVRVLTESTLAKRMRTEVLIGENRPSHLVQAKLAGLLNLCILVIGWL